jgi:hypothetical protein
MMIRSYARRATNCPVIFQTDWYLDEGRVIDMSSLGCAIETRRILIPDEYIQLHIILPTDALRVTVGKVRWSAFRRFGVEFVKVAKRDPSNPPAI